MSTFPKSAVITGGARGLGRAFAEALLQRGIKVVIGDIDTSLGYEAIQSFKVQFPNTQSLFVKCDVCNTHDLQGLMDTASAHIGPIDLFVNNAGIMAESKWNKMVDINLKGVIGGSFVAAEKMSKANGGRGGHVINIASIGGLQPAYSFAAYSATKFAAVGFTRSMAAGYSPAQGVRYNCLCPSYVDTDMLNTTDVRCTQAELTRLRQGEQYIVLKVSQVVAAFLKIVDTPDMNGAAMVVTPKGIVVKYDAGMDSKL